MIKQAFMRSIIGALLVAGATAAGAAGEAGRARPELWFPVGERLVYSLHWGVLRIGEAVAWTEWVDDDQRDLLAIRVTVRTVALMDKIYPVDDFLESIVDARTFLPLSYTRRLSEGRYRLHEITTFDHAARSAHWKHLLREDSENTFDIDEDTRDLLSFMYFVRAHPWEPNQVYDFRLMADEKLYDFQVRSGEYEKIKLPEYGEVRSLRLDPESKFKGFFVRVTRAHVWISEDSRRLCTRGYARLSVGNIRVILQNVEGPGDDRWVQRSGK